MPSGAEELASLPDDLVPDYDTSPRVRDMKEIVDGVKVLTFKSWWYEDKEEAASGKDARAARSRGGSESKRVEAH